MSDISISLEDAASRRSQTVSRCCLKLSPLAGLAILLAPEAAYAHIIQGTQGGFGSGFAHPLSGPDHFLAMFAVGLWSAQMGGRLVWSLPVTFPMIMVIGGFLGMTGLPLPGVEIGISQRVGKRSICGRCRAGGQRIRPHSWRRSPRAPAVEPPPAPRARGDFTASR